MRASKKLQALWDARWGQYSSRPWQLRGTSEGNRADVLFVKPGRQGLRDLVKGCQLKACHVTDKLQARFFSDIGRKNGTMAEAKMSYNNAIEMLTQITEGGHSLLVLLLALDLSDELLSVSVFHRGDIVHLQQLASGAPKGLNQPIEYHALGHGNATSPWAQFCVSPVRFFDVRESLEVARFLQYIDLILEDDRLLKPLYHSDLLFLRTGSAVVDSNQPLELMARWLAEHRMEGRIFSVGCCLPYDGGFLRVHGTNPSDSLSYTARRGVDPACLVQMKVTVVPFQLKRISPDGLRIYHYHPDSSAGLLLACETFVVFLPFRVKMVDDGGRSQVAAIDYNLAGVSLMGPEPKPGQSYKEAGTGTKITPSKLEAEYKMLSYDMARPNGMARLVAALEAAATVGQVCAPSGGAGASGDAAGGRG